MGYNSQYELRIEDRRSTEEEMIERLRATSEGAGYALGETGETEESCKWYDWREDMIKFSKENPGFLFTIIRRGEDSGDIEVGYFLNGTYQGGKAEMRLPDFEEKDQ